MQKLKEGPLWQDIYLLGYSRTPWVLPTRLFDDVDPLEWSLRALDAILLELPKPLYHAVDHFYICLSQDHIFDGQMTSSLWQDMHKSLSVTTMVGTATTPFQGLEDALRRAYMGDLRLFAISGIEPPDEQQLLFKSKEMRKTMHKIIYASSTGVRLNLLKSLKPFSLGTDKSKSTSAVAIMAEKLAYEAQIDRSDLDHWSWLANQRAFSQKYSNHIVPICPQPRCDRMLGKDELLAAPHNSLIEYKQDKPLFDQRFGLITDRHVAPQVSGASVLLATTKDNLDTLKYSGELIRIKQAMHTRLHSDNINLSQVTSLLSFLDQSKISIEEIDFFEIFDPSAAHVVSIFEEFSKRGIYLSKERFNVFGGTLARGSCGINDLLRMIGDAYSAIKSSGKKHALIHYVDSHLYMCHILLERATSTDSQKRTRKKKYATHKSSL